MKAGDKYQKKKQHISSARVAKNCHGQVQELFGALSSHLCTC